MADKNAKHMYTINDNIKKQEYKKLDVQKLVTSDSFEILSISLAKNATFPKHTSPTDANLIVLEGDIVFYINGQSYHLTHQQHFGFPKKVEHWVSANENSKFLIIR